MGILTIFFNRQIMKYLDTNALAVYGIVAYVSTFVQCCAYSAGQAGQAAQPIISTNYDARQGGRIGEPLRYALLTIAFFILFWTGLSLAAPNLYIRVFTTLGQRIASLSQFHFYHICQSSGFFKMR